MIYVKLNKEIINKKFLALSVSVDNLHCVKCENMNYNKSKIVNNEKCPLCRHNEIVSLNYNIVNDLSNKNISNSTKFIYSEKCVPCQFGTMPSEDKKSCIKCDNTQCFCNKVK